MCGDASGRLPQVCLCLVWKFNTRTVIIMLFIKVNSVSFSGPSLSSSTWCAWTRTEGTPASPASPTDSRRRSNISETKWRRWSSTWLRPRSWSAPVEATHKSSMKLLLLFYHHLPLFPCRHLVSGLWAVPVVGSVFLVSRGSAAASAFPTRLRRPWARQRLQSSYWGLFSPRWNLPAARSTL